MRHKTAGLAAAALIAAACGGAVAQGAGGTTGAGTRNVVVAQNPNVPAITGDRQAVPKPREATPGTNSTSGSATGLVTTAQRPQLREFALKHRDKEIKLRADLTVGSVLPADTTLLDIPAEFNLSRYRLALANQKTLLVDPATRRVEEVIE